MFCVVRNHPLRKGTRLRCRAGFDVKDFYYGLIITMNPRELRRSLNAVVLKFLKCKERDIGE